MEVQQNPVHTSTVPAYEEWPSVPSHPVKDVSRHESPMAVDSDRATIGMKRDTSALSLDDIEAAQALEGLRAGS